MSYCYFYFSELVEFFQHCRCESGNLLNKVRNWFIVKVQEVSCSTGVALANKLLIQLIVDSDEKEDNTANIIL